MDVLIEVLVQLFVQVFVEIIGQALIELGFKATANVLRDRVARMVLGVAAGLAFGIGWGAHLDGGQHWPKLLWVSLGLMVGALVLAAQRPRGERSGWDRPFAPPWQWPAERLLSFALLNLAIAGGIAATFRPG